MEKNDWKQTLLLPQTAFPMKADLNQKEPQLLAFWKEKQLYQEILKKRLGKPIFILHDGPPYANGKIHLGTALNKILKDFVVKSKSMQGFFAPYVPGWDCHGLPIELKVEQELKTKKVKLDRLAFRQACQQYAEKYLNLQRDDFIRLGVFGDWFNPYTTMQPEYEAYIVNCFNNFVKEGAVYRQKKPVYWCYSCETALADAEVAYDDHQSVSIYVKFPFFELPPFLSKYQNKKVYILIWTTTPWTLPANLAIAIHPEFDYTLFQIGDECYVAASRLVPVIAELCKASAYQKLEEFKGEQLKGYKARHPFIDRNSLLITADYVVLDQGTGCVHTAPGHGEEDYQSGLANKLDIYCPVDERGYFDQSVQKYAGMHIYKANPLIVEDLKKSGMLFYTESYCHSYPHCWRCHQPVIFRATEQWFISMEKSNLRQRAVEAVRKAKWYPAWGEERIENMLANRPDWCISRQRQWGVPLPVFYCPHCQHPLLSSEVIEHVRQIFKSKGSNSWYQLNENELLPPETVCPCGSKEFRKGMDIVDVWFESGASYGILRRLPDHAYPADIYLEGGDQYRGWFHSSLLVALPDTASAPYRNVITHGWVLDEKGIAMSKSLGNVIEPQKIIAAKGAEILRLWIAMVNYQEDVRLGDEILQRATESYRKIRNTWRFMLGVLNDFQPDSFLIKTPELSLLDRYMLQKLKEFKTEVIDHYNEYQFHLVFHKLLNFFTIELSSLYLNVQKDNLYCNPADSVSRRATQYTIFRLLQETALIAAPILSFTAEEVWQHLPNFNGKSFSVHLETFPSIENEDYLTSQEKVELTTILERREEALKKLEDARNQKLIGDSLEAEVKFRLLPERAALFIKHSELLKTLLVVSAVRISETDSEQIEVSRIDGKKCPRCWNRFQSEKEDELCARCQKVTQND